MRRRQGAQDGFAWGGGTSTGADQQALGSRVAPQAQTQRCRTESIMLTQSCLHGHLHDACGRGVDVATASSDREPVCPDDDPHGVRTPGRAPAPAWIDQGEAVDGISSALGSRPCVASRRPASDDARPETTTRNGPPSWAGLDPVKLPSGVRSPLYDCRSAGRSHVAFFRGVRSAGSHASPRSMHCPRRSAVDWPDAAVAEELRAPTRADLGPPATRPTASSSMRRGCHARCGARSTTSGA